MSIKEIKAHFIPEKLLQYGFIKRGDDYVKSFEITESQLVVGVTVKALRQLYYEVTDVLSGEPYVLHAISYATGEFVGQVRSECDRIIDEVIKNCSAYKAPDSEQAAEIARYAAEKYGSLPEYLWQDTPENRILRRSDNGKWYAAFLKVQRSRLGLTGAEAAEIIDLRAEPEKIASIIDGINYFPGYHMNKKHWFTIVADGRLDTSAICALLDDSYVIAGQKNKKK